MPPYFPRTAALRAVSRTCLAVFLAFAAVCGAVWFVSAYQNREAGYEAAFAAAAAGCSDGARGPMVSSEGEVYSDLHVAYTIAAADPEVWRADVAATVRGGVVLAAGTAATSDLQAVHYVDLPLRPYGETKKTGAAAGGEAGVLDLKDLRIGGFRPPSTTPRLDINLMLYVDGVPAPDAFATPECYFQRGWGVVCLVSGASDGGAAGAVGAADFRAAERYLSDMLATQYPPVTPATARARACGVLASLQAQLAHLPNLPLPGDVLTCVQKAAALLDAGDAVGALEEAWRAARHPALLTSQYFPADHLLAIYLPLYFPVVVTCLLGVVTEVKRTKIDRAAQS
eukprot:TRINITY_DN1893_c0_g3_i1.p1 TRINITY_DN1893_c0_g3~~TRINITY_DN1893_c0_g3_i1.p1  ORF type:complete len:341 (+),score=99.39 TRINITY_DN1893_c0_g3_i1:67-1089(+)